MRSDNRLEQFHLYVPPVQNSLSYSNPDGLHFGLIFLRPIWRPSSPFHQDLNHLQDILVCLWHYYCSRYLNTNIQGYFGLVQSEWQWCKQSSSSPYVLFPCSLLQLLEVKPRVISHKVTSGSDQNWKETSRTTQSVPEPSQLAPLSS